MSSEPDNGRDSESNSSDDDGINFEEKMENPTPNNQDEAEITIVHQYKNQGKKLTAEGIMDVLNVPRYEDVTVMINSTLPFLIDGDALIMYAFLQDNHKIALGGQYLHVIYFCERFLNLLLDKGGNFVIVFFQIWDKFWQENPYVKSLRLSVYKHLKENTDYRILSFPDFNSDVFESFLNKEKPRCVLLDLSYDLNLQKFNERTLAKSMNKLYASIKTALKIICFEIIHFRLNDLPCVDICEIDSEESVIFSFNLHPLKSKHNFLIRFLSCLVNNIKFNSPIVSENISTKTNFSCFDARRAIAIIASSKFLSVSDDTNTLKIILLYYAALEVLHLEDRCCPHVVFKKESLGKVQSIVAVWLDCIASVMEYCSEHDLKWNTIGDIWQGTMFSYICYLIRNCIYIGTELGHLQEAYENYITWVECETDKKIKAYPILSVCEIDDISLKDNKLGKRDKPSLYLLNNSIIRSFCGNAFQNVMWENPPSGLKIEEFDEIKHWHCRKPLTDDYDRQRDHDNYEQNVALSEEEKKRRERWKKKNSQMFARFLDMYGTSLNGGQIKSEAIICQQDKRKVKKEKESKKAIALKKKILTDKEQHNLNKEKEEVNKLKAAIKNSSNSADFDQKMNSINRVFQRLKSKETILSVNMLKLEIYRKYIKNLNSSALNTELIKNIFLTIRTVLQNNHDLFKEKEKLFLSKFLHELGFKEIANRNNLPMNISFDQVKNFDWVRFQLEHMGANMERLSDGIYDPDVGFTPDPWQAEFIEVIRKRQSALVVAPTSSGKTFAAYYCMKRVLQASEDGIVVYVAPTKALVNQVDATVYSRFKRTELRDGQAIVGVFTRDYKRNALNSRILITVPQCLDILLLSPRRYTWAKNLKYVIFDEVHKLLGNNEGLVWERCLLLIRCPFLALSATISDVDSFHQWLQSNENFKREQDEKRGNSRGSYNVEKIEYGKRHSDLIKHVYSTETDLQHYHPYCALDSRTIKNNNGIPPTIQLSPNEVLQLYDKMCLNELARRKLINERDIFNFFSEKTKNGFINRNEVIEYEQIIAKVFCEIHEEDEYEANGIISQLMRNSNFDNACTDESVISLLYSMHEKNFLPCIIFSYNRDLIEKSNYLMIRDCRKNEEKMLAETDKRTKKMNDKAAKIEKKLVERSEGSNKDDKVGKGGKRFRPSTVKSSGILKDTASVFKGEGIADSDDLKLIERRLARTDCKPLLINGLPYGIAYHHAGLNSVMRSTVEILFRMGIIKVVFATGTLALGIHMPCKSVVVYGDSPFLNSLEFHQMSGRAGRRGFDTEGNVIFMGLSKKRHDALMTDKLPKMLGNFPVNISLISRILLLVTKVTDKGKPSEEVTNIAGDIVLSLLENSLIFQFKPNLKVQIKHFVDFATQLLFIQGLYNANGVPLKLASILCHLHRHEPSNLVFAYLLRSGALRKLILSMDNAKDIEMSLIIVLSHLFARLKLHKLHQQRTFHNSKVILEPLPEVILKAIKKYNEEVKSIFDQYFISVAKHLESQLGKDDTLPVSKIKFSPMYTYDEDEDEDTLSAQIKSACVKRFACSSFIALSGNDDTNLFTGTMISNIRHEICPGLKVVPLLGTDVVLNSYAVDFYRHGILRAIEEDNGLRAGSEFALLKDFLLALKSIVMCLEELEPINEEDPVYIHFKNITETFDKLFFNAFSSFFQ